MRSRVACASFGALVWLGLAGCERAETPTTAETAPAEESMAPAEAPASQGASFSVTMSGAEEVPGPGDPDGTGTAQVTLDEAKGEVCYELSVENIQTANAAHIHTGAAGSAGGVAVTLDPPAQGMSKNCAATDAQVLRDIQQNPANYYVNVHNAEFPQGAVRGQLGK
jgi:hypothetical protein